MPMSKGKLTGGVKPYERGNDLSAAGMIKNHLTPKGGRPPNKAPCSDVSEKEYEEALHWEVWTGNDYIYYHGGMTSYSSELCIILGTEFDAEYTVTHSVEGKGKYEGVEPGLTYKVPGFSAQSSATAVSKLACWLACVKRNNGGKLPPIKYTRSGGNPEKPEGRAAAIPPKVYPKKKKFLFSR